MTNNELENVLKKHKEWLNTIYTDKPKGERADLSGADLRGANLRDANLSRADLGDAKLNYPISCPETGSFVGYKKAYDKRIVKLQITEESKRSSATNRKCRCSEAIV